MKSRHFRHLLYGPPDSTGVDLECRKVVKCGLWNAGPLLFNGCAKLLDIDRNWSTPYCLIRQSKASQTFSVGDTSGAYAGSYIQILATWGRAFIIMLQHAVMVVDEWSNNVLKDLITVSLSSSSVSPLLLTQHQEEVSSPLIPTPRSSKLQLPSSVATLSPLQHQEEVSSPLIPTPRNTKLLTRAMTSQASDAPVARTASVLDASRAYTTSAPNATGASLTRS
ncbi:uncharacterized protein LOC129190032 [Dunckerocampus dactyliophorus]|uniref:uncharacterized protein LOC129190032 n=1 Tax=Dunckerocampus dactyliophorus TaxID=161453 RepID=UPI0024049411|nr:uncharacterized protein LOC129190032 [Dunckerocampus dactyliophorus]